MTDFSVLAATHFFVASMAWAHGYSVAAFIHRSRDENDAWRRMTLDLTEPSLAYDWAIDGEATEVRP